MWIENSGLIFKNVPSLIIKLFCFILLIISQCKLSLGWVGNVVMLFSTITGKSDRVERGLTLAKNFTDFSKLTRTKILLVSGFKLLWWTPHTMYPQLRPIFTITLTDRSKMFSFSFISPTSVPKIWCLCSTMERFRSFKGGTTVKRRSSLGKREQCAGLGAFRLSTVARSKFRFTMPAWL